MNNNLLTREELQEKYQELGREYAYPYFYSISKANQHLFALGVHHTFDPKNYQFIKILGHWQDFIKVTKNTPRIVFVEGGVRPSYQTETESILESGEAGYTTFLAEANDISVVSPEPDEAEEVNKLLTKFTKDEIEYYYFARVSLQWTKLSLKPDFKDYVSKYLRRDQEKFNWPDYSFTIENMVKIHNTTKDHLFDVEKCQQCFYDSSNPIDNKVSDASSRFRDEYIVNTVKEYWDMGKSLFIVYGSGHVLTAEKVFKSFVS